MSLTAKQISDLDNSMTAAQNIALGTIIGELVGTTYIASGTFTPTAAVQDVDTGLTSVAHVTASLSGSPTANCAYVTATSASTAGNITVKTFKPSGSAVTTPIATTGSWVAIEWIAVGER